MKNVIVDGIQISNPDRVVYPDLRLTKLDVVKYYSAVSKRMFLYAENRPLSVIRCQGGINGGCFFRKHPNGNCIGTKILPIENSSGERSDYFYLNAPEGIVAQAQLGAVEFHSWGSRAGTLDYPDIMVFDLDPDEGMDLRRVRKGVSDLKRILDGLELTSFLKTSGGKGYHIVVPFAKSVGWESFRSFAKNTAMLLAQKYPSEYTANIRKINRKNRIYIDWVRNVRGATSVAPYSLRARNGAKVSTPIKWNELDKIAPDGITMQDALERVQKSDAWKGFFKVKQTIE